MRLEALRTRYVCTWGELAEKIQISRAMLDFVKNGTKEPGPKVLRKIIEAEQRMGLAVGSSNQRAAAKDEKLSAAAIMELLKDLKKEHARLAEKIEALESLMEK